MASSTASIKKAAKIIRQGGLVAFPTETVYGLGANAYDNEAVECIFKVKARPASDPLIVHSHDLKSALRYVDLSQRSEIRSKLDKLSCFWPGPLSVVLPKAESISNLVSAGLDTIAIRIPKHPLALDFLAECNLPIAAPSANPFGYISPTKAQHVKDSLGERVDLILDGGSCQVGVESTVISLVTEIPTILRPGGVSKEEIEQVIGQVNLRKGHCDQAAALASPGLLKHHYSPLTKVIKRGDLKVEKYPDKVGLISFGTDRPAEFDYHCVEQLSESSNHREIAAKLYSALRKQDSLDLDLIVIDSCEETGLGQAIMDRINRATAQS